MSKPKIRFNGFTEDWEQRKVSDMFKITRGNVLPVTMTDESQSDEKPYPVYSSQTKEQGLMGYYKEYLFEDAITWTTDGANAGTVNYRSGKFYCTNVCGVLLSDNNKANQMVSEALNRVSKSYVSYVGNPKLMNNVMADIEIKVPCSSIEQEKIGKYFEQLDHLITLHQRKCEQTKKLKKFMLQKIFPQNGKVVPEIRFEGFTEDWEQRKLGNIADIVGGGTPSTSKDEYWNGDIDWYAPAEIADQIYVDSSERKITEEGFNNSSAKMLPVGAVLFTSRAGIGKMAILRKKSCTNQGFQSIVPHKNELDSYFIYSRSEELKRYGETVGAGSTFVEVSGKQMAAMNLMMPPTIEEQIKIGDYFASLDHLITLHQHKCDELVKIKKYMLQNMFV